jgi:hypothetical protein
MALLWNQQYPIKAQHDTNPNRTRTGQTFDELILANGGGGIKQKNYIILNYVDYGAMPFIFQILQLAMDVGFIQERGLETLTTTLAANLNGQPMDVPLQNGGECGKLPTTLLHHQANHSTSTLQTLRMMDPTPALKLDMVLLAQQRTSLLLSRKLNRGVLSHTEQSTPTVVKI